MENTQINLLQEKIESAHFDISSYPYLKEFANSLSKEFVECFNEHWTGQPVELRDTHFTARSLEQSLEGMEKRYLLFMNLHPRKAESLFLSVSGVVAGAIAEALFGGECWLEDGEDDPTSIDAAVMIMVLERVFSFIGQYSFPASDVVHAPMNVKALSFSAPETYVNADATYCHLGIDFSAGDGKVTDGVIFHLPMEYLESHGLLTKSRKRQVAFDEETRWRRDLKENVERTEMPLDIVLDKFDANLSFLANLNVGDEIKLPDSTEKESNIILDTPNGRRVIGRGRLGVYRDRKALKLISDLDPIMTKEF